MQTLFRRHKYIAFMIIVNKSIMPRNTNRLNMIFTSSEYGNIFSLLKNVSGMKVKMIEIMFSVHMKLLRKKFNIVETPALCYSSMDGGSIAEAFSINSSVVYLFTIP